MAETALLKHVHRYNESHRTPANRALHVVGIPMALTAGMGLLAKLRKPDGPDFGLPLVAAGALWYVCEDRKLGAASAAALLAAYAVGRNLSMKEIAALATAGAVAHWIGHYAFEKKPPLFLTRPVAALEAVPWLFALAAGEER
jgi:uncharacterized membrane protein YGL010W